MPSTSKNWPHAPLHKFDSDGIYMVTSATYFKRHLFQGGDRLTLLENSLLTLAREYAWHLEAWAVFSNHYHFIARNDIGSGELNAFLKHLHADTARAINKEDDAQSRNVWHNFWDSKLTYQQSYFARLKYVHQNPVKHGLVKVATEYPWCSALV